LDDVREVSRYVDALFYALDQIRTGSLPLSLRLLKEIHRRLLAGGRGGTQAPGEFRRTQNWVGGTRPGNATYVPPPPHEVLPALGNLEKYIHDEFGPTPTLVKAAIAHAQFETIHPFLDGNGRIGRLLISIMLVADRTLTHPFFYISLHFKRNRADYYAALQRIRTEGDWEGWLRFFLIGTEAVATEATATAETLFDLFATDRARVEKLGRAAPSTLKVFDFLREKILVSPTRAAEALGLTWPTVQAAVKRLEALGIAKEVTGKRRDRIYAYEKQLRVLDEGTSVVPLVGT
jgi:Fic family protein